MQTAPCHSQLNDLNYDAGSYRDRNGRVFYRAGNVYRGISERALKNWQLLSKARFFTEAIKDGRIVLTERVNDVSSFAEAQPSGWVAILKHERIPFVSYPYEWSFGMVKDAALLQLGLLASALEEDFVLKDGSAYNVQWRGAQPVFIDIPSWERLEAGEPWVGYRQFCQTLLYPMLLQAYKNVPFHAWLRGNLDGIEPEHCNRLMSWRDLFRPGVFSHVYLHAKLQSRLASTNRSVASDLRSAGFHRAMIQSNVRGLERIVQRLTWKQSQSVWSEYATSNSYTDADQAVKERFVRGAVAQKHRQLVWDLGANTGHYARIAAENSDYVVALDGDHLAVERLYQSLRQEGCTKVLPLVGNLVDASPNLGWRGAERKRLIERSRPDLVLALALIHHIVIGANVPLHEFVRWLASLGDELVVEFVHKDDPMVRALLRNKRDDYADYEIGHFEQVLSSAFQSVQRETLACGTRTLYHAMTIKDSGL